MVAATLTREQNADALLFLNNYNEELATLASGQGRLAIKFVKALLIGMPTFESNIRLFLILGTRVFHQWK